MVYDDGELPVRLLFASQAIGDYWPAYQRRLIVDDGSRFDVAIDTANARTIDEIAKVEAWAGGRVQHLVAERGIRWNSPPQAAEAC